MKPILFNTAMVRAILEGRKTVTRRVVKGVENDWEFLQTEWNPAMTKVDRNGEEYPQEVEGFWATFEWDGLPEFPLIKAQYEPGDILYVRETWCWCPCWDCGGLSEDGTTCQEDGIERVYFAKYSDYGCFCYKASCMDNEVPSADVWHPSIHMPREAARLFLRVTGVRVERLQDCGNAQAKDEGCTCCSQFARVWDSTIKPKEMRLYGWEVNPWVWVIEFERITKEEAMKT